MVTRLTLGCTLGVMACSASNPRFSTPADIGELDDAGDGGATSSDAAIDGTIDATVDQAMLGDDAGGVDLAGRDLVPPLPDLVPVDLVCVPMPVACGLCGTQTLNCDGSRTLCTGEGVCSPGDKQYTGDNCEVRTCGADCRWSVWGLKPGAQCATGFVQSCNAGLNCGHAGTQTCVVATCQWGPCICQ